MTTPTPVLPPLLRDQRKVDLRHLRLLSIFHFVGAGLGVIGIMFTVLHFVVMNFIMSNPEMWKTTDQAPSPEQFFAVFHMFKWFYAVMGVWNLFSVVLNILSGIALLKRKWRIFSLIVAGTNCLHIPLGTALGVFTIVVLVRESVGELYEGPNQSADRTLRSGLELSGSDVP